MRRYRISKDPEWLPQKVVYAVFYADITPSFLWRPAKVDGWYRTGGPFESLEDAEYYIKSRCEPPLEYDEHGNRIK